MNEVENTLSSITALIIELVERRKHGCVIVHGQIGAGKTRLAERLAAALKECGLRVGGIISPRILNGRNTIGYQVHDIETDEERLFAKLDPPGIPIGKFYLLEDAVDFAHTAIARTATTSQVVFLDEVGRLELAGQGHAPALRAVLQSEAISVLFVRTTFVEHIIERFEIVDYVTFSAG